MARNGASAVGANGRQSALHDKRRQPPCTTGRAQSNACGDQVDPARRAALGLTGRWTELNESDCNLLTAASVIRREFAAPAVAAALEISGVQVEATCARFARQGVFIVKSGSTIWPDGTCAELFTFRHDLYRELLYERLPATRRAVSHVRVGNRLGGRLGQQARRYRSRAGRAFRAWQRACPRDPPPSARSEQGLAPQRQRGGDWPSAASARRHRSYRGWRQAD